MQGDNLDKLAIARTAKDKRARRSTRPIYLVLYVVIAVAIVIFLAWLFLSKGARGQGWKRIPCLSGPAAGKTQGERLCGGTAQGRCCCKGNGPAHFHHGSGRQPGAAKDR